MDIILKDTFDKDALEKAQLGIEKRQAEIKILQNAVDHYKRLCRHPKGYRYIGMFGSRGFHCDDCGYYAN